MTQKWKYQLLRSTCNYFFSPLPFSISLLKSGQKGNARSLNLALAPRGAEQAICCNPSIKSVSFSWRASLYWAWWNALGTRRLTAVNEHSPSEGRAARCRIWTIARVYLPQPHHGCKQLEIGGWDEWETEEKRHATGGFSPWVGLFLSPLFE